MFKNSKCWHCYGNKWKHCSHYPKCRYIFDVRRGASEIISASWDRFMVIVWNGVFVYGKMVGQICRVWALWRLSHSFPSVYLIRFTPAFSSLYHHSITFAMVCLLLARLWFSFSHSFCLHFFAQFGHTICRLFVFVWLLGLRLVFRLFVCSSMVRVL